MPGAETQACKTPAIMVSIVFVTHTLSVTDAAVWSWIPCRARTHPSFTSRPAAARGSAHLPANSYSKTAPEWPASPKGGKQPDVGAQPCSWALWEALVSPCASKRQFSAARPTWTPVPGTLGCSPHCSARCARLSPGLARLLAHSGGESYPSPQHFSLPGHRSLARVAAHSRTCQYAPAAGGTAEYLSTYLHGLSVRSRKPAWKCRVNASWGVVFPDSSSGADGKSKRGLESEAYFTAHCCCVFSNQLTLGWTLASLYQLLKNHRSAFPFCNTSLAMGESLPASVASGWSIQTLWWPPLWRTVPHCLTCFSSNQLHG